MIGTDEFDIDGSPAEIGAHAEVSDTSSKVNSGSYVEKYAIAPRLCSCTADAGKSDDTHDGHDGVVEIRTLNGNANVDMFTVLGVGVDIKGVVSGCRGCRSQKDDGEKAHGQGHGVEVSFFVCK